MFEISPAEWTAILLSLRVAVVATLVATPFGIALAWLLARREFWGKSVLDAVVHLPLVLPPVVTGYLLLTLGRRGLIGAWLAWALRGPHLYDMHSSLPQQLTNFAFSGSALVRRAFLAIERFMIRRSRVVIVICPSLEDTVKANNKVDGYIRLLVTRGPGNLGLDPRSCKPNVIVIGDDSSLYPKELYENFTALREAIEHEHETALAPRSAVLQS